MQSTNPQASRRILSLLSTGWGLTARFFLIGSMAGLAVASLAGSASAEELSSASYRHLAGSFSGGAAAGAKALTSEATQPVYSSSDVTIGASPLAQPSGSLGTLSTALPGFWAIVVGAFPTLDLDGDFAQYFLDEDDDGDGLDDVVETGTGVFVSSSNTGTSATSADSDQDGFTDGEEVQAGSDPNDPFSLPIVPPVPSLAVPLRLLLVGLMLSLAGFWLRRRESDRHMFVSGSGARGDV